ncbi:MAG: sensor histidine kinase [bacterium]
MKIVMISFLAQVLNTDFMPHGHCYFWEPFILWSHAISDSIIALAYFVIPISLVQIVRKRDDFRYMWMLVMFAIFILGCGTTHLFDVITIWKPYYYVDAIVRIITAAASIGTAVLLLFITPRLILIPSAAKWKRLNEELKLLNETLESKVQERTAELYRSAAQFEFLTDTIPQIVWTADAHGSIDYLNQNWYSFSNLSREDSLGSSWISAIHPEDRDTTVEAWQRALSQRSRFQAEFRLRNGHDGIYHWHLGRALPMKDEDGKVNKWFGTATDIDTQKRNQEELQRVNEELDNFVYTASHDLKAPISNLEGLLQLMKQKLHSQMEMGLQRVFEMMSLQVHKLKLIISDLSDVGKIRREAADYFEEVGLLELVKEFQINNHERIRQKNATITTRLGEEKVYFSSRLMRSVIHNLLDNAIKYSKPEVPPEIELTSEMTNNQLVMKVKDNGRGIAPEHQQKIFGMFTRFNRDQEGTGIGLYIVKRIMEEYGGMITLDSKPGEGTTFILRMNFIK